MPNIKSAIKRVEVAKINNARNKSEKSKIATYIKRFKNAIANKDIQTAETEYKTVVSLLDNAARKNVIHKNSASRKSAHLAKLLSDAKTK
ncbi:MAG: 30S ribosomal protein S20 [Clostridia bacterium]|jgi:small subunit ribosomal protein S20|nr:30S ribosomal protein S20 [Clostridia bacterium]MBR5226517.1 30S ribosomal protein S20 [Clostridia bacterium]